MILILRHLAIRLSLSVVMAIPASFILIARFNGAFSRTNTFLTAGCILLFFFMITGFFMNLAGKAIIRKRIGEAEKWERAGGNKKSEHIYKTAIHIFDSCLLGPWASRKIAKELTGAIARFALVFSNNSSCFEKATADFLKNAPHEKEIVALWLKKMVKADHLAPFEHHLLTRMAEAQHPGDPKLLQLMAEIFIRTGRMDFAAKKTFAALQSTQEINSKTHENIKNYIGTKEPQKNEQTHRKHIFPISVPTFTDEKKEQKTTTPRFLKTSAFIATLPATFFFFLQNISRTIINYFIKTTKTIKDNKKTINIIKWTTVSLLCVGFIILIGNTIFHLSPPKPTPQIMEKKIEAKIATKAFTIQVAAYLKKKHAEKYVKKLEAKGLAAYITKTQGGGKTWYLVRISHFDDKQTATEFGRKLQKNAIIDDFFVDNSGNSPTG